MSKGFTSSYRIALVAGLVLALFGSLGARLFWLHVIDRDNLLRSVEEERRQLIVQNARRGDILDARGALLATSRSVIVLGVDPQALRAEEEKKWPKLAALVGMPEADLRRILTTKFRSVALPPVKIQSSSPATVNFTAVSAAEVESPKEVAAADAAAPTGDSWSWGRPGAEDTGASDQVSSPATGDELQLGEADQQGNRPIRWAKLSDAISETTYEDITKLGIHGIYGSRAYRRDYPHNELAAHIIGYVDRGEKPVAGMEHYADFYLRGQNGWLESEKDGKSREMAQFRTREVPASDGYSVVLSIDSTVQHIVEEELGRIADRFQPQKATIIVSDPRTGFILALANYPSFDLNGYNKLTRDEQGRMRNVAVADQYEPGSVFKIVAASGALNEGLVTQASTFDCTLEKIDYNGITRSLPHEDRSDHFDHPLSVSEIISRSSNRGAAQLAMALGDERFYNYARAFGFGQYTGFPVGGEIQGNLRSPSKWDSLTITRMPMGQSVGATALQMHQAMGVIASGGVLLRPQVIRRIDDEHGEVVYRFGRAEVRRVILESTARTMAHMLMGVVSTEGTAPEAAIDGYEVAGKTGTSQKLLPVTLGSGATVLRYSEHHHVASFVGFFPASRPQVAISVIVDDADAHAPGGVAYGKSVAAPAFKRIGEQLIPYLDIQQPIDANTQRVLAMGGGFR